MNKSTQPRPFGIRDKFSYMMGDVGCNIVLSLANSYLLVFYTKVMGVSAAIVGTLFMLARFVDAFTDMAVGRIVDTHVNKNGERYRYWIAYATIPLVIMSTLMYSYFLAGAAMGVKIAWLIITYLLFGSVCYTAVNIPYGAMSAVITDVPAERSSLSTWRSMGSTIGGGVLGVIIPLVVYTKDADGNSVANGPHFFVAAAILGAAAGLCLYICWKGSVERVKIADKKVEKKSNDLKIIGQCLKDRAVLMNVCYCVFIYAATTVFSTFNQYLFLDYFGSTSLSGLASLCLLAGMLLSAPVATIFAKRIGKKEISVIGLGLSTVIYAFLMIFHIKSVMLYFVCVVLAFLGLGIVTMVSYALMNDCIDNYFLKTGEQVGGTIYAMNSFMRKMAGAICTGVGGWGLALISYDELAVVQTAEVQNGVYNLAMGVPAVCFALALIFMILFPLNRKKVDEIADGMEKYRSSASVEE